MITLKVLSKIHINRNHKYHNESQHTSKVMMCVVLFMSKKRACNFTTEYLNC